MHRVSGLVGPAECSPYYGTLSPSLSLPHSFRSSFLPSFPPCPLSFSTTSILLCTVPMPRLSLSLSPLYPCKSYIIAGSLFACCVGRVQRASLFISNTMCINVCTSKIVRVYIYICIYTNRAQECIYVFPFLPDYTMIPTACQCPRD